VDDPAEKLKETKEKLIAWVPSFPPDLNSSYSQEEIAGMGAQAFMYRTAALLIIHRLINPIGSADDIARSYGSSIISALSDYFSIFPTTKLQHVTVPTFLAMLETGKLPEEILGKLTKLGGASVVTSKLALAVEVAWERRLNGFHGSIFELMESGPDFNIVP
jgi:hypothetical protein